MRLKICGLREKENIERISAMRPHYIGLIFYKRSPRYAGDRLRPEHLDSVQGTTGKVGVFVNERVKVVIETVTRYGLDAVQLHGDETPGYCSDLKDKGIEVIKAFYPDSDNDFKRIKDYNAVCDYFLFDSRGRGRGGSGKKFNWDILSKYDLEKQYFLSGGIGPHDAETIRQISDKYLYAIDINSRFEKEPGLKDVNLISEFINKLGIRQ
ncbi:MAG: phosphoribosylanthranilate isomerase [Bacteroidales bacterium]|nr:phosphoribosylanthranilate isomerase [Bacteroidales bacterium]